MPRSLLKFKTSFDRYYSKIVGFQLLQMPISKPNWYCKQKLKVWVGHSVVYFQTGPACWMLMPRILLKFKTSFDRYSKIIGFILEEIEISKAKFILKVGPITQ